MIVAHADNVIATAINHPEVKAAAMKVLIGPQEGWGDHVMRVIELEVGGHSPDHAHPWPHINYMLSGQGVLTVDGREHTVESNSYAFVPAGSRHQFKNTGSDLFRFICIVPKQGHQ